MQTQIIHALFLAPLFLVAGAAGFIVGARLAMGWVAGERDEAIDTHCSELATLSRAYAGLGRLAMRATAYQAVRVARTIARHGTQGTLAMPVATPVLAMPRVRVARTGVRVLWSVDAPTPAQCSVRRMAA